MRRYKVYDTTNWSTGEIQTRGVFLQEVDHTGHIHNISGNVVIIKQGYAYNDDYDSAWIGPEYLLVSNFAWHIEDAIEQVKNKAIDGIVQQKKIIDEAKKKISRFKKFAEGHISIVDSETDNSLNLLPEGKKEQTNYFEKKESEYKEKRKLKEIELLKAQLKKLEESNEV